MFHNVSLRSLSTSSKRSFAVPARPIAFGTSAQDRIQKDQQDFRDKLALEARLKQLLGCGLNHMRDLGLLHVGALPMKELPNQYRRKDEVIVYNHAPDAQAQALVLTWHAKKREAIMPHAPQLEALAQQLNRPVVLAFTRPWF